MNFFSPFDGYQIVLGAVLASVWGVGCGVFERMVMAPRRHFSATSAAYAPAMTLCLVAGAVSVTTQGRSLISAIAMAGIFFGIGFLPAVACFHFVRLVLRTNFSGG
jgi:hypothetical protein